jgi:hypothetical protein
MKNYRNLFYFFFFYRLSCEGISWMMSEHTIQLTRTLIISLNFYKKCIFWSAYNHVGVVIICLQLISSKTIENMDKNGLVKKHNEGIILERVQLVEDKPSNSVDLESDTTNRSHHYKQVHFYPSCSCLIGAIVCLKDWFRPWLSDTFTFINFYFLRTL